MNKVIDAELEKQASADKTASIGPVSKMASEYAFSTSNRLLGLVLKLDFAESIFATCDPWKRKCGGVPRGSFVIFKVDPAAVGSEDAESCRRLLLARVKDAAPTPVESNVQQTLFQMHKLQAPPDPITQKDFQWGALTASLVGTFFDEPDGQGGFRMGFGNDVDSFLSPFAYAVYMPTEEHLSTLINSFVRTAQPVRIGYLRYTETPSPGASIAIPIMIDPKDLVGEHNAAQRLANFGKTRFGKSNSTKIISNAVFSSGLNVAQVFFDPIGEYTYINDQDGTSLFALHNDKSVRYSLSPRIRADEVKMGLSAPKPLKVNFYENPSVGHTLIVSLWDTENTSTPGYMRPILDWSPTDPKSAPKKDDHSGFNHYWRTMGMWYALMHKADFTPPSGLKVPITFCKNVKAELASITGVALSKGTFDEAGQPITVLPMIYSRVFQLHKQHPDPKDKDWFPASSDGSAYFNDTELKLLQILANENGWTGHNYVRPFNKYHSPAGSSIFAEICALVSTGKSVFIDLSQGNEAVRNNIVEKICREIFALQNKRFNSEEGLAGRFVMLYFEEAHRLFRADDKDLNSIYNLLAKEGAKLNIAMVYSTQSMTTISPDLIKNTDNFLIAHLDDDRETREVSRKYAFRDVAEDVQRIQSKGFVRMITRSHRFALPVQIDLFKAPVDHQK
jgi:hypothetical protein